MKVKLSKINEQEIESIFKIFFLFLNHVNKTLVPVDYLFPNEKLGCAKIKLNILKVHINYQE